MVPFVRAKRFEERSTRFQGVIGHDGWRLKRYDITLDGEPVPQASFRDGISAALALLPRPATTPDRPGVGFLICHRGAHACYVVLCWWDNQNELLQHVLVRFDSDHSRWIDAEGRFSFCVWDLEVMWHERESFVRHVLTPSAGPEVERYLEDAWESVGNANACTNSPGRTLISSGSTFEAEVGYSRAVVVGEQVFVAGTTGFDYTTMTIADDIESQTEQCIKNIDSALARAGASLDDVVRVHYILPDASLFQRTWPTLRRAFGTARPAATMLAAGLSDPRMKIEIEVTAIRGSGVRAQRP
jgi:enamine deaminase RidA (YjgF/YER057c/UK114 family)